MISRPHKAKQFLIVVTKLLIVGGAFYFIYKKLSNEDSLNWDKFIFVLQKEQSYTSIAFVLLLGVLDRYFEILKWQNLVSSFRKITISESAKQVFAALTFGVFTLNGLGEYAGKALFFSKSNTSKILFLNFICNGIQIILAIVFGILGLLFFNANYNVITTKTVEELFGFILILMISFFFIKKIRIKGYSIETLIHKINETPKAIHQKNMLFAICRYEFFTHQYYFLLLTFNVDLPYLILISTITSVYLLSSALPTFQFLDFAVRGSVAVYFFGILGINEWIVIFSTTLIWFLNVVLPVLIGSYFVIRFNSISMEVEAKI